MPGRPRPVKDILSTRVALLPAWSMRLCKWVHDEGGCIRGWANASSQTILIRTAADAFEIPAWRVPLTLAQAKVPYTHGTERLASLCGSPRNGAECY